MADTSDETLSADARVRSQVEDALELANHVVSSGVKGSGGQLLPLEDIATIQRPRLRSGCSTSSPTHRAPPVVAQAAS